MTRIPRAAVIAIVLLTLANTVGLGVIGALGVTAKNDVQDLSVSTHRATILASRKACERTIRDRHANAESWYGAYVARLAQARAGGPLATVNYETARTYLATAESLNSRTDPADSVTWPRNSVRHPIGVGTLNCVTAFPL